MARRRATAQKPRPLRGVVVAEALHPARGHHADAQEHREVQRDADHLVHEQLVQGDLRGGQPTDSLDAPDGVGDWAHRRAELRGVRVAAPRAPRVDSARALAPPSCCPRRAALVVSVGPPAGDIANYLTAASLCPRGRPRPPLRPMVVHRPGRAGGLPGRWWVSRCSRRRRPCCWPPCCPWASRARSPPGGRSRPCWGQAWRPPGRAGPPRRRWSGRLGLGLAPLLAGPALESICAGAAALPAVLAWASVGRRGRREGGGPALGLAVGLKVHARPLLAPAAVLRRWRSSGSPWGRSARAGW